MANSRLFNEQESYLNILIDRGGAAFPCNTTYILGESEEQVVKQNFRAEPALCKDRSRIIEEGLTPSGSFVSESLEEWIHKFGLQYQLDREESSNDPYYWGAHNKDNVCFDINATLENGIYPDFSLTNISQLIHVKSLNSLIKRAPNSPIDKLYINKEINKLVEVIIDDSDHSIQIPDLARKMVDLNQKKRLTLLNKLFSFIPEPTYKGPQWAALENEILAPETQSDNFLNSKEIINRLGMGMIPKEDWLLCIKYPAELAQVVYKPTVLEAGIYPYYHPNHPGSSSGASMPLCDGLPSAKEYVHRPINYYPPEKCELYLLHPLGEGIVSPECLWKKRKLHQRGLYKSDPKWVSDYWNI